MSKEYGSAHSPVYCALKVILATPLMLLGGNAMALTVIDDGKEHSVSAASPDNYIVRNNSTLSVLERGVTREIEVNRAKLNITGGTVQGTTFGDAVWLINSKASITDATISSSVGRGMSLARVRGRSEGSEARVENSDITGATHGITATAYSKLELASGSTVQGLGGDGLQLFSAQAKVSDTVIDGAQNGIYLLTDSSIELEKQVLTLDNSTVVGRVGSAILVDAGDATIEVRNGTTLSGGNGNVLELIENSSATMRVASSALLGNVQVGEGSTASLSFDRASLTGNVLVAEGGHASVLLDNQSLLTGHLENVDSLAINNDANWLLTGSNQVNTLSLNGGHVTFGEPGEFYRLDVNELSGNGTFHMTADFATGEGDRLNVAGQASGQHVLAISASGTEPAAVERLTVVTTGGGDAQFSLLNGRPVDLGAFSYGLTQDGNDWHLDQETKTVSPGTKSVLALFNTAPTVWYGELSSLRTRMGELRHNGGQSGGWGRAYGSKYNVADASGVGYKQTQQGFTLGADGRLPVGDGQWLVGVLAGHSKSDLDLNLGTSGTIDSYYAGAYATWLDEASGYYFDGVVKLNRFDNKSKVGLSDGSQAKGKYKNTGVGASAEFGRHIKLDDGYFVEPFTQLSAVSIQAKDYDLDNGLQAEGDRTMSILGKAGATAGRNFDLGEGRFAQPYVRAAAVHEFAKNNKVKVNNNVFNNDLSGSRGEVGMGVSVSLSERLQLHADFDYSNGDKIEKPWGANVGVRFNW
ncbi:putative autotransporter precursor [compost metagenome]